MARRNDQTQNRRNPSARGRRVTSQGGMQGSNVARNDVFPMVEKLAHQNQQQNPIIASMQRFYNGQSPTGLKPSIRPWTDPTTVGGGGSTRPYTNPGGTNKSPGPGGKVNPGGPMQTGGWFNTTPKDILSGALRESGIKPNSYFSQNGSFRLPFLEAIAAAGPQGRDVSGMLGDNQQVNPGGPMQGGGGGQNFRVNPNPGGGGNYWTQKRMDNARPMGNPEGFDPRGLQINPGGPNNGGGGGTNHNHGPSSHDHPGGGPGHTHDTSGGGGQNVNPGGPQQGGGQNQAPPQYVQNWSPAHPDAFARRFPTYDAYTQGVQDPRRQGFYDWAMSQQQGQGGGGQQNGQGGGQQQQQQQNGGGGGQGGGGQGGGGPQPDLSATPGNYPTPNSYLPPGSPPVPGAGTPMTSEPASLTGAPPGSYPWANAGYQAPPSNVGWYNPGVGGFAGAQPPTSAPVPYATADQLAQQYGLQVGLGQAKPQLANPSGGTQPWWADPAPPGPGVYDPWVESRLIGGAYKPQGGDLGGFQQAYLQAAGGDNAYTRLAMQQYLAHKAGYQGYGALTAPSPYGYAAGAGG